MTREEFKNEYTKDSFFWIANAEEADNIQSILLEFGLLLHTGKAEKIIWHDGFKNLCTFPPSEWKNFPHFQKADIWHPNARYGAPVNYEKFISDYESLTLPR